MANKCSLNIIHPILIFILALWLGACNPDKSPLNPAYESTMEETMKQSQHNGSPPAQIPAIDAAAPDLFETATFGLG